MTDIEKLKHLLEHWIEHNKEHVRVYREWADRAEAVGRKELAGILRDIAMENERMEGLFKKALEDIKKG
jgi:rubrerythrin